MRDEDKTKEQLAKELAELRQRFAELEAAETSSKQTEERYRHLYESSPIGIGLASPNGKVVSCNKAMETIFGYSSEELKEVNIPDLYENPEDRKSLIEAMNRYGGVVNFPVRLKRKNGTPFDCLLTISQFHSPTGENLFQTICIDITEHKRTEEAMRESERRYRQLFEGIGDAVMVYGSQGRFLDANKITLQRYGYSYEELLCLVAADIVCPDFHQVMKENQEIIWAGENTIVESVHRCKDGRVIPVEVNSRSINYQGESAILSVVRDITDRKRIEEALRASQEKYRAVVENANEAIVVAQDGMLRFFNPKIIEITGYSEEELTSRPFVEFVHTDDREMVVQRHRRRLRGKEFLDVYPFRIIDKEGNIKWMETNVVLIEWEKRPATLNFLSDITERKQAEQALREREKELESKTSNLEEANTALRVLLKTREEDKTELEEKILFNVKRLVEPLVEKLKKSGLDDRQEAYLSIMESNLNDIISPFARRFSSLYLDLTPTEIEVADLVKHGKTTKEIAELLNVSSQGINFHRKNIRKKIGIQNKKANLRTHLLSMQ